MAVEIKGEHIPVYYAHNIWSDNKIAGVVVGVALVALLAVVGTYMLYPLRGLGFASLGPWMLGSAGCLLAVEILAIILWVKIGEPHYEVNPDWLHSFKRFNDEENAFDFSPVFKSNGHSYIAYFIKEGTDKRIVIFRNNDSAGEFFDYIGEDHAWKHEGALKQF